MRTRAERDKVLPGQNCPLSRAVPTERSSSASTKMMKRCNPRDLRRIPTPRQERPKTKVLSLPELDRVARLQLSGLLAVDLQRDDNERGADCQTQETHEGGLQASIFAALHSRPSHFRRTISQTLRSCLHHCKAVTESKRHPELTFHSTFFFRPQYRVTSVTEHRSFPA